MDLSTKIEQVSTERQKLWMSHSEFASKSRCNGLTCNRRRCVLPLFGGGRCWSCRTVPPGPRTEPGRPSSLFNVNKWQQNSLKIYFFASTRAAPSAACWTKLISCVPMDGTRKEQNRRLNLPGNIHLFVEIVNVSLSFHWNIIVFGIMNILDSWSRNKKS